MKNTYAIHTVSALKQTYHIITPFRWWRCYNMYLNDVIIKRFINIAVGICVHEEVESIVSNREITINISTGAMPNNGYVANELIPGVHPFESREYQPQGVL